MDRAWEKNAAASPPSPPSSPSIGYPTAGDPSSGTPATLPGAWWYHMVTESLREIVTSAGLTPDHTDVTLVRQALQKAFAALDANGEVVQLPAGAAAALATAALTPSGWTSGAVWHEGDAASSLVEAGGHQRFPNGLILQWGFVANSGVATTVTWPIAFPTACLGVALSADKRVGNPNPAYIVHITAGGPVTTTGMIVNCVNVTDGSQHTETQDLIRFLAVGY
ncbi:hypothetical protein G3N55_00045 [Dissulfurirhabdus thermomarina]|uniref:Putative tail fiber protein gp53-like C-terminal domain-containing protein n=1 Tax=Dissulfurirhabdus thermomarina TaxID=1765737 RepID=A0A6N9TLE1_DISTH|nr:hypothetical protein [Dissulfurirhabdus thermomarina]NDY41240.1 hypothetical protein [Dissulfurirhabdus thermomarina]